jgi:hypothetical protein
VAVNEGNTVTLCGNSDAVVWPLVQAIAAYHLSYLFCLVVCILAVGSFPEERSFAGRCALRIPFSVQECG